jgi:hypothetical protein
MLNNSYIKNVGSTQTIIGNRCQSHVQEMDWNADYDGDRAKVLLRTNTDGDKHKYQFTLDNDDLANILNIDSVNIPIHKRLKTDFKKPGFIHKPNLYRIQLPAPEVMREPFSSTSFPSSSTSFPSSSTSLSDLISESPDSYLSSPSSDDEFIIPVSLNEDPYKKYTFTPKRRNLTLKTHKTYRAFKHPKSSRRSKNKQANSYSN